MNPTTKIEISIGSSRRSKAWKTKELGWPDLAAKLTVTHRTHETFAEYLAMKPDQQATVKDIGGFVGGRMTGRRRVKGSVQYRQLLTLDADHASADLWGDWQTLYGNAAVVYTTHKHSPASPRYRLVIPLLRPVTPEEYPAIARKVADVLGIEQFDPTGYQVERLMYWPSTSKDGVFFADECAAEWLDPDKVLNSYRDWTDSTQWPTADSEDEIVQRDIKKQGDPLEKKGIVGAFCRTYDIHEAIGKYLSDVYEPCYVEGRYTYLQGSTSGGLVIYDDKFAYSHHGTDPISGKLCNAFDLVRLHKFSVQDEDVSAGTSTVKLPSFKAMADLAESDPAVRRLLLDEKVDSAKHFFEDENDVEQAETIEEETEVSNSWKGEMTMKRGEFENTINNLLLILQNDLNIKEAVAYDVFARRSVLRKDLPWRKVKYSERFVLDSDLAALEHYIETLYGIKNTESKLAKALQVLSIKNSFHPVRDYLSALEWDGVSRVDDLLIKYMGVQDSIYTRAVTRKTLVAAVARVFNPGCKFDYVLTLVGGQGEKKSSLIAKLGKEWFSDTFNFHMLRTKEGYEALQGVWLIEIGELSGLGKAEIENVKSFVSATNDRYRGAYGKLTEDRLRQCIFFATTNKTEFLRDQTGNRRFWPVLINSDDAKKDVFQDLTDFEIDQVWAEALQRFKEKETLYLSSEQEALAVKTQDKHTEEDDRAGLVRQYLEMEVPEQWEKLSMAERRRYFQTGELDSFEEDGPRKKQTVVCTVAIWCEVFNGELKNSDRRNTDFIRDTINKTPGWRRVSTKNFKAYGRQRTYMRSPVVSGKANKSNKTSNTE